MTKTILTVAALAVLAVPMTSMAVDNSFYIKANAGIGMAMDSDIDNMPNNAGTAKITYDSGWVGSAAVGFDFAGPMRTDVEYIWQKNDVDTLLYKNQYGNFTEGDFKTQTVMVNGYYDIKTGTPWTPYIGGGIGWAKLDLNTPGLPSSDYDDTVAYQIIGGVAYDVTSQFYIDAQYRFMATGDATISGADYDLTTNNVMLGFGYSF
jgi:opacity protein-like surface antigen